MNNFFKNNSLVFVLISVESGSVSHKLKDVKINGDVIDVTVKEKYLKQELVIWLKDSNV